MENFFCLTYFEAMAYFTGISIYLLIYVYIFVLYLAIMRDIVNEHGEINKKKP